MGSKLKLPAPPLDGATQNRIRQELRVAMRNYFTNRLEGPENSEYPKILDLLFETKEVLIDIIREVDRPWVGAFDSKLFEIQCQINFMERKING